MSDRIDKLENAVKKLAADVGSHRAETKNQGKQLHQLAERFDEFADSLKDIKRTQLALTNAMTMAMKQLAVDKSLELRMQRVEEAVFGSKH